MRQLIFSPPPFDDGWRLPAWFGEAATLIEWSTEREDLVRGGGIPGWTASLIAGVAREHAIAFPTTRRVATDSQDTIACGGVIRRRCLLGTVAPSSAEELFTSGTYDWSQQGAAGLFFPGRRTPLPVDQLRPLLRGIRQTIEGRSVPLKTIALLPGTDGGAAALFPGSAVAPSAVMDVLNSLARLADRDGVRVVRRRRGATWFKPD